MNGSNPTRYTLRRNTVSIMIFAFFFKLIKLKIIFFWIKLIIDRPLAQLLNAHAIDAGG